MRRHHLIEEAKAELDVAYEEVKRTESKVMELEQTYNDKVNTAPESNGIEREDIIRDLMNEKEGLQNSFNLEQMYQLQTSAVERFAMISSAFSIVGSVDNDAVSVDLIRNILFPNHEYRNYKIEIDSSLRAFCRGLRAYSRDDSNAANDKKVRVAWAKIEDLLRELGRKI